MEFEEEIKRFLEINIELIELNEYHQLYAAFRNKFPTRAWGQLTALFLKADINPLLDCGKLTPRYYAFNTSLQIESIPNNIHVITERAFEKNKAITKMYLPPALGMIQNYAFLNCRNLSYINIPSSLQELGDSCFEDTGLIKLDLFNTSISELPYRCLAYTRALEECKLPKGLLEIKENAFRGSHIKDILLPVSLKKIGNTAFADTNWLKEIFYHGTQEQWNDIRKYETWNLDSAIEVIHCSDGNITIK